MITNSTPAGTEVTFILSFSQIKDFFIQTLINECCDIFKRGQLPKTIDIEDLTNRFIYSILEPIRLRDPVVYKYLNEQAVIRLTHDLSMSAYNAHHLDLNAKALRVAALVETIVINQLSTTIPLIDSENVYLLSYKCVGDCVYIVLSFN